MNLFWSVIYDVSLESQEHRKVNHIGSPKSLTSIANSTWKETQRRPSTDVSDVGLNNLDAVVWVKTPGESDGTTDTSGRYDPKCTSSDSMIPAPEAGKWFEDFYVMLVNDANPPLWNHQISKVSE